MMGSPYITESARRHATLLALNRPPVEFAVEQWVGERGERFFTTLFVPVSSECDQILQSQPLCPS